MVLEFNGGTYVFQVSAESVSEALASWSDDLNFEIIDAPSISKRLFVNEIVDQKIVELKDLTNVWCTSCEVNDLLAIVHIVKTVSKI